MRESDKFIKLHCVTSLPGNPVRVQYVRASEIIAFGPPAEEYAKIGAAGAIDIRPNDRMYVSEGEDDIFMALSKVGDD